MNNPPAFPQSDPLSIEAEKGMSLRDYFAGQALNGLLREKPFHRSLVREAYCLADDMLKERKKRKK